MAGAAQAFVLAGQHRDQFEGQGGGGAQFELIETGVGPGELGPQIEDELLLLAGHQPLDGPQLDQGWIEAQLQLAQAGGPRRVVAEQARLQQQILAGIGGLEQFPWLQVRGGPGAPVPPWLLLDHHRRALGLGQLVPGAFGHLHPLFVEIVGDVEQLVATAGAQLDAGAGGELPLPGKGGEEPAPVQADQGRGHHHLGGVALAVDLHLAEVGPLALAHVQLEPSHLDEAHLLQGETLLQAHEDLAVLPLLKGPPDLLAAGVQAAVGDAHVVGGGGCPGLSRRTWSSQ